MCNYYLKIVDPEFNDSYIEFLTKDVTMLRIILLNRNYYNCFYYEVICQSEDETKEYVALTDFEIKLLLLNM